MCPTEFVDSLFAKEANTRLRAAIQLQDTVANGLRNWRMLFNGRDIGGAFARPVNKGWQMGDVRLDKEFQGMGLGKLLYGRIMQALRPGERLVSGAQVSPQAEAVWGSMIRRPGLWSASAASFPGAGPQAAVKPQGPYTGKIYPSAAQYEQLQQTLKAGPPGAPKPYHYQAVRNPAGTPAAPKPLAPPPLER